MSFVPRNIRRKLRGKPEFFVVLTVVFVTLVGVMLLQSFVFNESPDGSLERGQLLYANVASIASASVGAAVSLLVSFFVAYLSKPDKENMPLNFLSALDNELTKVGFYRSEQRFEIHFEERENNQYFLTFVFNSTICKLDGISAIDNKVPNWSAPETSNLEKIEGSEDYYYDGEKYVPGSDFQINKKESDESYKITFLVKDISKPVEEKHRWNCPVDRFSVRIYAPNNFQSDVKILKGKKAYSMDRKSARKSKLFTHTTGLFSQQGFIYTIHQ